MAEPRFTPGPWNWEWVSARASGGGHLYLIDSTGRKIAALWGKAEEKEANARLTATAPELAAFVEKVRATIAPAAPGPAGDDYLNGGGKDRIDALVDEAAELLARAGFAHDEARHAGEANG